VEIFDQPLDDRPTIEVRRTHEFPHQRCTGGGPAKGIKHGQPEPLCIMLAVVH
jgi:hypothetical protein